MRICKIMEEVAQMAQLAHRFEGIYIRVRHIYANVENRVNIC